VRLPGPGSPGDQRAATRAAEVRARNAETHRKLVASGVHHSGRPRNDRLSPGRPDPEKRANAKRVDMKHDAILTRLEEEMLRIEQEIAKL
jgi:hypothetical protein